MQEFPKMLYRGGWADLSDQRIVADADAEADARADGYADLASPAEGEAATAAPAGRKRKAAPAEGEAT